jgi:hypothetical protein
VLALSRVDVKRKQGIHILEEIWWKLVRYWKLISVWVSGLIKKVVSINYWPSGTIRGGTVCYLQFSHVHYGKLQFLLSTLL